MKEMFTDVGFKGKINLKFAPKFEEIGNGKRTRVFGEFQSGLFFEYLQVSEKKKRKREKEKKEKRKKKKMEKKM